MLTSFDAFYKARKLENIRESFLSVYASSNIKVYPFQIAAADFAINSPYKKGAVLCDESRMRKSHEAMLKAVQKWYEGKKVIIFVPNFDFICQWIEIIDKYYTVPYTVIENKEQWDNNCCQDNNAFEQEGIILTTYSFACDYSKYAKKIQCDLTIFDEATALSSVYKEENKQAKILKEISENSFKLLLTGTPIEKNIMDLYGLIYFIDEEILPDEQFFLRRYLRKPENYPELSKIAGRYYFRTLKEQAKQYAKVTNRIFITYEYVQDETLRERMDKISKKEKSRERKEKRTAYVKDDVKWLENRKDWAGLICIGAIHTEIESKKRKTSEWHYYITSKHLTADKLLYHARKEWSVETMHWLLDVHFEEDFCRAEDKNIQQNLNMLRKLALNIIKQYKSTTKSKKAISKIMFDCLLDYTSLLKVI